MPKINTEEKDRPEKNKGEKSVRPEDAFRKEFTLDPAQENAVLKAEVAEMQKQLAAAIETISRQQQQLSVSLQTAPAPPAEAPPALQAEALPAPQAEALPAPQVVALPATQVGTEKTSPEVEKRDLQSVDSFSDLVIIAHTLSSFSK
ncbi:hypothetical protein RF55_19457 [Lasius niger]|uniref:Uncharacterized protein n=1 Tax=Lasius niger TaxID=67767 RepID=A0A0J7JZQ1_LASNI|nr:hypothetical protein RF55_19457 [Lasius niger]